MEKILELLKINFKGEDSRFLLLTGVKFASVFLLVVGLVLYFFWIMVSLNSVFFESYGLIGSETLRTAYMDYVLGSLWDSAWIVGIFLIALFITGMYLGFMLIRPFVIIGEFAEKVIEDKNTEFLPDPYSDFKLLNRFSEFFFRYLEDSRNGKQLTKNSIPPQFSKIHKPMFDAVFFLHFAIMMLVVIIIVSLFIYYSSVEIHGNIINLALSNIKSQSDQVKHFLSNQEYIFSSLLWFSIGLIVTIYSVMALHLYSKVSGAAFGIFATMRSYMKGNFHARVHLLEYNHIRPYGRMINKYLDYMQKNHS